MAHPKLGRCPNQKWMRTLTTQESLDFSHSECQLSYGQTLEDLDWSQVHSWDFKEIFIIGGTKDDAEDLGNRDFEIKKVWFDANGQHYVLTEQQIKSLNQLR